MADDNVPIWFGLIKIELADFKSIPFFNNLVLVTNKSSPIDVILLPNLFCNNCQPDQSSSDSPSSIEIIGYFSIKFS